MERLRVLTADNDARFSFRLSAMLRQIGHTVVADARDGRDAIKKTSSLCPDLVIMDIQMEDMDGFEAAKQMLEQRPLPIVILTGITRPELLDQVDALGGAWCLLKPCSLKELQLALTQVWSRFQQLQALKLEIRDLQETIRSRKLIERAKGRLMEREGITEEEAFRRIQRMSRDRNIAMIKIAEAILMTNELMGVKIH